MARGARLVLTGLLRTSSRRVGRVEDGRGCSGRPGRYWSRFPSPLIEPDLRISRIRLSDQLHPSSYRGRRPQVDPALSDSCQSPALAWVGSVPEGRVLRSTGVTRLPRYHGPVRLPAGPVLLSENGKVANSARRGLPFRTAVSLGSHAVPTTPDHPGGASGCKCRLLPDPCGLPRSSGGSASAIFLWTLGGEACSALPRVRCAFRWAFGARSVRVPARQLARPAFPGLCHEAFARPVTRPSRSSASMLTDNYS